MAKHLPVLRWYAEQARSAVELGVKHGGSSTALLLGCYENTEEWGGPRVHSFDIQETPRAKELALLMGSAWDYRIEDSRRVEQVACDLLFVDSLHVYEQTRDELKHWGPWVTRFLVFHDTVTFGSVGAQGETGRHDPDKLGIRHAIDEFMQAFPKWKIDYVSADSHGLLVLKR